MQVYFDAETIEFYKAYARQQGKSFAELMRDILNEKQSLLVKKQKIPKKRKLEDRYQALLDSINKLNKKFSKVKYHYPEISDDELLYGKYAR